MNTINTIDDFILTIIFSDFTIQKIFDFLVYFLDAKEDEICAYNILSYKKSETNETLMLIKKTLYNRAIGEGLNFAQPNLDFRMVEYKFTEKNFPTQSQTGNLFIKIWENGLRAEEMQVIISEKMQPFLKHGLLGNTDFKIRVPLASRTIGTPCGFVNINFSNADVKVKTWIKLILHNSSVYLSAQKRLCVKAFWANK